MKAAPLSVALALAIAATVGGEVPSTDADEMPIFVDGSAATGLDFIHFNGMTGELYFSEVVGGGAALFDYDGDGDLDVYLVQGHLLGEGKSLTDAVLPAPGEAPFRDRLFRNDLEVAADGARRLRFTDVTDESGIDSRGYGMGVATGDYDGDGWTDLYVTNFGPNQLWRNRGPDADGRVTFEDATATASVDDSRWSIAASFLDLDADGRLDLYVGNYVDYTLAMEKRCTTTAGARDYCGPLAFDPVPDRLFHNRGPDARGDVSFSDISRAAGVTSAGPSLGVATADFNGDGRVDFYVANDGAANFLWMNQGAGDDGTVTFIDEALFAGCAVNWQGQPEASMGVDAGDVDGDGDADLFMAHLDSESNTLYLNDGEGLFRDGTRGADLSGASWGFTAFGTALFDYDNDGLLDLLTVNGAVRILDELLQRKDPHPLRQTNQLFRNTSSGDGGVRFVEVTESAGDVFELAEVSRGAAFGDLDDDGDVDVVVTNNGGPARLLLNQVGQDSAWLGVRLLTGSPGRDALGARVALYRADGPPLWRRVYTDGSYASASDPRVVFGLGDGAAKLDKVRVEWPDGSVDEWPVPTLGTYTTLRQGTGREGG